MLKRILLPFFLYFTACNSSNELSYALYSAEQNREEIKKILDHYKQSSVEYDAAVYLIENMPYKYSYGGDLIEIFRNSVNESKTRISLPEQWKNLKDSLSLSVRLEYDIHKMQADFLIEHIDFAVQTWNCSPWKDSISFDRFKEYILPYSINTEPLTLWRKPLYEKYHVLVEHITSPKEAFDKIYNHIIANFKLIDGTRDFFVIDPLVIHKTMRGTCAARTMYIVAVARALNIPAAYDYTHFWSNYSQLGHTWAVYIDEQEETFYFSDYDSVSTRKGVIDASFFPSYVEYDYTDLPFTVDSLKRPGKVMRYSFTANHRSDIIKDEYCPVYLKSNNTKDVGSQYGLNATLELPLKKRIYGNVYLCNFLTGQDWQPIYVSKQSGRRIVFENLSPHTIYLTADLSSGKLHPLANPVILESDGTQRVLDPNENSLRSITIGRKYPLFTRWLPNRWNKYIGVTFEGSNDEQFMLKDTLHLIREVPVGITEVGIDNQNYYRYLRIHPPVRTRLTMSETVFYGMRQDGQEIELSGEIIFHNIPEENARKVFDKDYMSSLSARSNYYWVGYDLGVENQARVTRIEYCPENDGNLIERGDLYELFYYNLGWHSLGSKIAEFPFLTFDNVPQNALLWIRNLSKGSEERVFTYENEKQVFW